MTVLDLSTLTEEQRAGFEEWTDNISDAAYTRGYADGNKARPVPEDWRKSLVWYQHRIAQLQVNLRISARRKRHGRDIASKAIRELAQERAVSGYLRGEVAELRATLERLIAGREA